MLQDNNLDAEACEIAASFGIVSYCSLFQVSLGSITCLIFFCSFLVKACHSAGFLCPISVTLMKKKIFKISTEFDSAYENEFDFECGDDDESVIQLQAV